MGLLSGDDVSVKPREDLRLDLAELLRVDRDEEIVDRFEVERLPPNVRPRCTFSVGVISVMLT